MSERGTVNVCVCVCVCVPESVSEKYDHSASDRDSERKCGLRKA
jgi:hypothetical protein